MAQLVVIDREETNNQKLAPQSATGSTPPTALNTSSTMTAISMGNGIVRYQTSVTSASSSSGVTTPLVFNKPHRLVRVELQLLTSSTSGTPDNFTGQVNFGRITPNNAAAMGALLSDMYFSTNGTPTATNNIVFVAGTSYENDACEYLLQYTAPNNDLLLINVVVQYL